MNMSYRQGVKLGFDRGSRVPFSDDVPITNESLMCRENPITDTSRMTILMITPGHF